jgi:chorismate mutase
LATADTVRPAIAAVPDTPAAPDAGDTPGASDGSNGPAAELLVELRGEIERIDRQLIELIAERVRLAREVGAVKSELGIPTLDPAREAAVVRRAGVLAREAGVGAEDVRYIFWHLIGLSRRAQMEGE